MKTREIEKNGSFSYEIGEYTTVNNVPAGIPYNVFIEMVEYLVEGGSIPQFDEERNIITDIYSNYILIEYGSNITRKKDRENNEKINIINPIKSETLDDLRQIGRNVGEFVYNGKYYLVLYPYNALTDETNPEKGVFRGVIVDLGKYSKVQNHVDETITDVQDILKDKKSLS